MAVRNVLVFLKYHGKENGPLFKGELQTTQACPFISQTFLSWVLNIVLFSVGCFLSKGHKRRHPFSPLSVLNTLQLRDGTTKCV